MQSGREPSWREIPVDELRRFVAELVRDSNLREAARLIGRGREQVRKFVSGDIENPHPNTREAIARLYVQRQQGAALRAAEVKVETPTRTPLKLILPQPAEKATAEIRAIFDLLRHCAPELPPSAPALEKWLLTHVKDEYAAEIPYPRPRQRQPRKKPTGG